MEAELGGGARCLLLRGGGPGQPGLGPYADINPRHEAAMEGREHQASFEPDRGGEAGREGPSSPAAESVAQRAYPRSYVNDKLAKRSESAFEGRMRLTVPWVRSRVEPPAP